MILTTRNEVEARLGRALDPTEDARFDTAARDVSAFLYSAAPKIPTTLPIPDAVVGVASYLVIDVLARVPGTGSGITSEGLGGYQVTYSSGGGGGGPLSLSESQKIALRPWMGASGIGTMSIDPGTAVAV